MLCNSDWFILVTSDDQSSLQKPHMDVNQSNHLNLDIVRDSVDEFDCCYDDVSTPPAHTTYTSTNDAADDDDFDSCFDNIILPSTKNNGMTLQADDKCVSDITCSNKQNLMDVLKRKRNET